MLPIGAPGPNPVLRYKAAPAHRLAVFAQDSVNHVNFVTLSHAFQAVAAAAFSAPSRGGERAMTMPSVESPAGTVTRFLAMWEIPGGLDQSVRDYFTAATVWENVGLARTTGIDEAIALNHQLMDSFGMATIRVENLAVATTGDKVLTERIDHMVAADGRVLFSAPVMGIFEIADGRIAAWRDYFDSAGAAALMAGAARETGGAGA